MSQTNIAYTSTPQGMRLLFIVLSGVLQGCPLSGSLFVIVIDPLLHIFRIKLEDTALGKVRACADDVGVALKVFKALSILHDVFCVFKNVSGLTLEPSKCVMIITCFETSECNIRVIRRYLHKFCPDWSEMSIVNTAKYLGIFLGPRSGPVQWTKALCKFHDMIGRYTHLSSPLN
jgi:hypothetical protein